MIDTVIFDMDGVIIDSEPIHMEIEQEIFNSLGITIPKEKHFTFVGTSTKNMWEAIITEYNLDIDLDEIIRRNKSSYRKKLTETSITPIDGVSPLIKTLHESGFKLALASSSIPEEIETVLNMFSLNSFFQKVVSGSHVQYSKPHPEIFLHTARELNSLPQNCLVIEDSENGVRAAKSAGMKCIGFRNLNSGNQNLELADKVITSFSELEIVLISQL
jgi:beta-phosphoglucomutase family hydrolase